jgi:peptidoglycan/LPS O-acetylase OafA/YrhL
VEGSQSLTPELRVPSLDGLRAVSWFVVFLSHAFPFVGLPGQFGVSVFFFLSGYLITTLLRLEWEKSGQIDLRAFYVRRAFRILPPFYIVLGIALLLAVVVPGAVVEGDSVVALVCHYINYFVAARQGYETLPPGTVVYWSLAVEEHFYLVFPFVFVALQRLGSAQRRAAALWLICALVLAWRSWLVFGVHAGGLRTFMGTDTRVDSLLFGCSLAIWGNPMLDGAGKISDKVWKLGIFPLAMAVIMVCFALAGWQRFRESARYSIQAIALLPVFVCAMRFPSWLPFRLLNHRIAKIVGGLSYSLYLIHYPLLAALHRTGFKPVPAAVVGFVGSMVMAMALKRWVEDPSRRLRSQLLARLRAARADEPSVQHV